MRRRLVAAPVASSRRALARFASVASCLGLVLLATPGFPIDTPRTDEPAAPETAVPAADRLAPVSIEPQQQQGKRQKDRLPPPSADQLRVLRELEAEAKLFEEGARDYQQTLDQIVRHHYEERRRRLVTHLDRQIARERVLLRQTRERAIRRLSDFIERYSGPRAHPEATPDAMYRLAALYEEKGRTDKELSLEEALRPAIALYRRVISEFPTYKEIAGVHYYLGHAYFDAARLDEAQQAWRSLVCKNHFSVTDDPKDASKILTEPLAQDHDDAFWNEWYAKNPIPIDQRGAERNPSRREEQTYVDPYAGCEALPQEVKPDEEPRYVAEVWWQLGNFHFDQLDEGAGPYAFNRAATAYERSMEWKKPPLYGVAMYKRAWTYYKQQRYREAIKWFVELLRYSDEQEKETGDAGADFRAEAYTYIAGSLTYTDLDGPLAAHPFIPRSDVLDEETDPVRAEERLRIAIVRVQDPSLIPQDEKWTGDIYKALAQEFLEITQTRNAVATLELTLEKFPLDPDAPRIQDQIATLYDAIAQLAPDGSAVREEATNKALAARTKLADYVGDTPWTRANQEDPEALHNAEQLVRLGLQRAAADHTNAARALVARAGQMSDETAKNRLLQRAVDEYRMAAKGWAGVIDQDPNGIDAYENRFWLADARYWAVNLQLDMGLSPADKEVAGAARAARRVRDSNEDDKYLQPAAYYLVALADKLLDVRYLEHEASGGARGVARREAVEFEGEGEKRKVKRYTLPREVVAAAAVRDEYNEAVDSEDDPEQNGPLYAFQAADYYFVYGQFDEARRRFERIYVNNCGANEWGYRAWEKLVSMSNFQGDADRSRQLVDSKSCAFDEATRVAEEAIRKPVRQGVAYLDARKLYDAAEQMPEGDARDEKWREAAAAYKIALDAAPDRDEAPEAAMNGAYAYKQVGEYDKAIEMYELFISRYGNNEKLQAIRDGAPNADPPVQADPKKYATRAKYLKGAYDALANAYVLFFDYPKAATTFDAIGQSPHFPEEQRRSAAEQAMNLYASLGDDAAMRRARDRYAGLGATGKEVAQADFVVASASLKEWDQFSPDEGANRAARRQAEAVMTSYYQSHEADPAATEYVIEAAYWIAKMKRSGGDSQETKWWQRAMAAFSQLKANAGNNERGVNAALGTRHASMAAEGAYLLLDEDIAKNFDYETGHHRFKGTPQEVIAAYNTAAKSAKEWFDQLQAIVDDYGSPLWGTAAVARQGSLYDSLRSGLYNTRPPELKMFDDKTERMLQQAEESDNLDLQEKADAIRVKVESAWQEKRDRELASADQIVVDRYGNAVVLARRYNLSTPAVARAIRRLAFLTDVVGEAKMQSYASRVKDLSYSTGMFPRLRPGMVTAPEASALPGPTPAAGGAP